MSSSFSTEAPPSQAIASQLARAFALLAHDAAAANSEIAQRLGDARVRIQVDDETFDVACTHDQPQVLPASGTATVTIETSRATVRDVLGGHATMADALHDDTLRARGTLRDLVAVLAALDAFVHGAIRCTAMPELFDDLQTERVA